MLLFEYSYLQNNGQKTKWLIQITENSRYGSDQFMIPNYSGGIICE